MGIHPVGGSSGASEPSSNEFFMQRDYNDHYQAFLQNPTSEGAQKFVTFLEKNKTSLTQLANQVGYQPSQGASWENNLNGLINGLHEFMHGETGVLPSVYELSGQCATWIGIGQSPEDIVKAVDTMIDAFSKSPSHHLGVAIQWVLNTPGYIRALDACSKDVTKTEADIKECQKNIALYENDPTNPTYTKNIIASLDELKRTLH